MFYSHFDQYNLSLLSLLYTEIMDWTERFICNDNTRSVNMAEQVPIHHNKWQYQKQTDSNVFYLSFIGYAIYTKGRQSQFLWWYMLSFLDVAFLLTGNNDVFFLLWSVQWTHQKVVHQAMLHIVLLTAFLRLFVSYVWLAQHLMDLKLTWCLLFRKQHVMLT